MSPEQQLALAEAVRRACAEAAEQACERAAMSGLCSEGQQEAAVGAIRALDLEAIVAGFAPG